MVKSCNEFSFFCWTGRHKFPQICHSKQLNLSWQTGHKSAFQALTCKMRCICQLSISGRETGPVCPHPQSEGSTYCKSRWDKAGLLLLGVSRALRSTDTDATSKQPFPDHGKQQNSEMSHKWEHNIHTHIQTNPQASSYSNTYQCHSRERNKIKSVFRAHDTHILFFPRPVAYSLGRKQPSFHLRAAHNSLSSMLASLQTVLSAWEDTLPLMLKQATRYSPIHRRTHPTTYFKHPHWSQLTTSQLLHSLSVTASCFHVYRYAWMGQSSTVVTPQGFSWEKSRISASQQHLPDLIFHAWGLMMLITNLHSSLLQTLPAGAPKQAQPEDVHTPLTWALPMCNSAH